LTENKVGISQQRLILVSWLEFESFHPSLASSLESLVSSLKSSRVI